MRNVSSSIYGEQRPRSDCTSAQIPCHGFAHAWDEPESVHFAHARRHIFSWGGPNEFYCVHTTDNPLYTDTRFNDKIRQNDNLNVTKPSQKRKRLVSNYTRILYLLLQRNICFGYLLESPHRRDSNKYPKRKLYEEIRTKQGRSYIWLAYESAH